MQTAFNVLPQCMTSTNANTISQVVFASIIVRVTKQLFVSFLYLAVTYLVGIFFSWFLTEKELKWDFFFRADSMILSLLNVFQKC